MNLDKAIKESLNVDPPVLPELRYLKSAVKKIRERWPSVIPDLDREDREKLALQFQEIMQTNDWRGIKLSFVLSAARAVLDDERRDRPDLKDARTFLFEETKASISQSFLSGMLSIFIETFIVSAEHTKILAHQLSTVTSRMAGSEQALMRQLPELLDPTDGPAKLAVRVLSMSSPYRELEAAGISAPHGDGFMFWTHIELAGLLRGKLTTLDKIDWYLHWLMPAGQKARHTGAEHSIGTLVSPWLGSMPPDEIRSRLVEALISMYGDPRTRRSEVWSTVGESDLTVIHRWLTREDMRFFTDVVDAAQSDNMWPPRRDFWLKLYEEGLIDQAWVAFSTEALGYARRHLIQQDAPHTENRFGWQSARHNLSLLIMKIGDKIMVDGCHSYKTHVFSSDDPMAPSLFDMGYNCEEIRMASRKSKAHNSIRVWSRWVRDMINADVPHSKRRQPYSRTVPPRISARSFNHNILYKGNKD